MIGLLNSKLDSKNYECCSLLKSAANLGYQMYLLDDAPRDMKFDFVINRRYLECCASLQQGIQINRFTDGYFWSDKTRQMQLYVDCAVPATLIGSFTFDTLRRHLGVPFIAKRSCSFGGSGVFLVKSQEDFDRATACNYFQEFISSSIGKDVRVLCIGGIPKYAIERSNADDFRSNVKVGADAKSIKADNELLDITRSLYEQTGLKVFSADFMYGRDGYIFCEINVNPGFKAIDNACNTNVARDILKLVKDE